jgi:hypothetical protein
MEEDQLSKEVKEFISSMINISDFKDTVDVLEKQQVLMNLTVGRDPKTKNWQYYIGMQQQDIVFILAMNRIPLK